MKFTYLKNPFQRKFGMHFTDQFKEDFNSWYVSMESILQINILDFNCHLLPFLCDTTENLPKYGF